MHESPWTVHDCRQNPEIIARQQCNVDAYSGTAAGHGGAGWVLR
jgi:hypothetical protein